MASSNAAQGQCPRCGDNNLYTASVCSGCSSRLPWADAVGGRNQLMSIVMNFVKQKMPQINCQACGKPFAIGQVTDNHICRQCMAMFEEEDRIGRQQELEAIIAGNLPIGNLTPGKIALKQDEIVHFCNVAALFEEKYLGRQYQGGSQGMSFRVMKGISYRVGSSRGYSVPVTGVVQVDVNGLFLITNQRCLFDGTKITFSIPHNKLVSYRTYENGIELHPEGKKKTQIFSFVDEQPKGTVTDSEMAAAILSAIIQKM